MKLLGGLLLLTLLVYFPALGGHYLAWDDVRHITENPWLTEGRIGLLWTYPYYSLYIPTIYTVWTAIYALSDSPVGFHLFNVVLHALNAYLVIRLARRLQLSPLQQVVAALIFLLHPLQVETVAWISGGRDLLSTTLALTATELLLTSTKGVWFAFPVFALAVLAKPTIGPWPVIAFLLFYSQLKNSKLKLSALGLWTVGGAIAILYAKQVQQSSADGYVPEISFGEHLLVGLDSLGFYIQKWFIPWPLSTDYGRQPDRVLIEHLYIKTVLFSGLLFSAVALAVFRLKSWRPALYLMAVLIALSPTLGVITFQAQFHSTISDRYTYLAFIPLALWLAPQLNTVKWKQILVGIVLILWAGLSFHRTRVFESNDSLYKDMLAYNPESYMATNAQGVLLYREGHKPEGLALIEKAQRLRPNHASGLANVAQIYAELGYYDRLRTEVEPRLQDTEFLRINQSNTRPLFNLYLAVARGQHRTDRFAEANENYCKAFELNPEEAEFRTEFENFLRDMKSRFGRVLPCL